MILLGDPSKSHQICRPISGFLQNMRSSWNVFFPVSGANYHKPTISPSYMAKNSFYIRASVNLGNSGSFNQEEIDIGSYTDLGSSKPEILRIHDVQIALTDSAGQMPTMTGDTGDSLAWQITTQSQSALVLVDDNSFVSGGRAALRNPDSAVTPPTQAWENQIMAQDWMNGYLVAVPTLYLGGLGGNNFTEDVYASVILECSTEPATKATSISLAISQM